jgi:GNAT superfamily N-acetyltransferase
MRRYDLSSAAQDVSLLDLSQGFDRELLSRFYGEIMEPAFPPDELLSLQQLEHGLAGGAGRVRAVLAVASERVVLGGIVGQWFPASRVLLISYVVVHPDHQGQGIGTLLLKSTPLKWCLEHKALLGVGEVEDPRFHSGWAGQDPIARLKLYARFPVWVCLPSYIQPRIRPDRERVRNMLLLAFHVDPTTHVDGGPQPVIDRRVVRAFLEEYYTWAEGEQVVTDDPEVCGLLEQTNPAGALPLMVLSDYTSRWL